MHVQLLVQGVEFHMAYCRKIYASWLRQSGIESEIIDMLSGKVGKNIFVRHYYRPSIEYKDRVLKAVSELRKELEK
jgi:intergrase/recombinase